MEILHEGLSLFFPKAHIDITFFYPGSSEPEMTYPEKEIWRFPKAEKEAVLETLATLVTQSPDSPYLYLENRASLPFVDQTKFLTDQKIHNFACEDMLILPIVEESKQVIGMIMVHMWHQHVPVSTLPEFSQRITQATEYVKAAALATTNLVMHQKIEQWASDKQIIQSQRYEDKEGLRKRVLELTALCEITTILAQSTGDARVISKVVAALQKVQMLEVVSLILTITDPPEMMTIANVKIEEEALHQLQSQAFKVYQGHKGVPIEMEKLKIGMESNTPVEGFVTVAPKPTHSTHRVLEFEGECIGVLSVSLKDEDPDHLHFLQTVAQQLALHFGALHRQKIVQRSKLESLVSSMPEGVIVIDAKQQIEMMNDMSKILLDLPHEPAPNIEQLETRLIELGLYHHYKACLKDAIPASNLEIQSGDKALLVNIGPVGDQNRHHLGTILVIRDFTEIQKSNRIKAQRLEVVSQANRIIRSVAELDNLLPVIMDYILYIANTDMGSIMIKKDEQFVTRVHSNFPGKILKYYRFQNGECIADHVIKTHDIVYVDNYTQNTAVQPNPRVLLDYYICLPVVIKNDLLAVINIAQKYGNTKLKLTQEDIMTFDAIASLIGTAIYNAILYQEALLKQRQDEELRVANEIQGKLLPRVVPALNQAKLGAISIPTKDIGGDYYDFIALENGNIGIIIADIVGKGVSAGLFMAMLKSIACTHLQNTTSPKEAVTKMNEILLKEPVMEKFVPLFYGIYDNKNRTFTYCNAGHEPAIFLSQDKVSLLDTEGLPLGSLSESTYTEKELKLKDGDIVFMYTDGLVESRSVDGQELGHEHMIKWLKKHQDLSAQELINQLFIHTNRFTAGAPAHDDITMVLLKAELTEKDAHPVKIEKYKFNSEKTHIRTIRDHAEKIAKHMGFDADNVFSIKLAINEAHANVIEHTYGGVPTGEIVFHFCVFHDRLEIMIKDFAPGTDQHTILASKNLDQLEGSGFGVFLMYSVMDQVEYRRSDKVGTELWMTKYLKNKDKKGK